MSKLKKNPFRKIMQFGVILIITASFFKIFGNEDFDPEAYCPFGGLQTLATYFEQGSMACSMTATQIMMGVVLLVGVMLFGKLFCSYLCPLGLVTEILGKVRRKLKVKELVIANGTIADKVLRAVKYILLFTIFYFTVTSSELFCKNFDPYYAFATGFKGEITVWMVLISITICFLGSFFVKMFWCKYICPLGAISNIAKFGLTFLGYLALFILLGVLGINISWVFLLVAVCVTSYLYEIIYMKSKVFPALAIVRDEEACNGCGVCAKKCPYSINIDKLSVVKHIDCTACGGCISACNKDALTFNRSKNLRWAPPIIVIVLFAIGVILGSTMELPTIDERWGDTAKHENLEKVEVEGLRSVKCFGSSKAFAAKLQKIPGVYGVATFVQHSTANIYYNATETSDSLIRSAIYEPTKFKISEPTAADSLIKVLTIRTEGMHDKMDPNYLGLQFRNSGRAYFGLETEYDCPIIVRLYMGINEPIDKKFLKEMVEMETLQMPVHGGGTREVEVGYELIDIEPQIDTVTRKEFMVRQFNGAKYNYKTNAEKYVDEKVSVYELVYRDLDKPLIMRNMPYLSSCLSLTDGVVGLEILVTDNLEYAARVSFIESAISSSDLWSLINAETWKVKMKTGELVDEPVKFRFPKEGVVLE